MQLTQISRPVRPVVILINQKINFSYKVRRVCKEQGREKEKDCSEHLLRIFIVYIYSTWAITITIMDRRSIHFHVGSPVEY